MKMSSPGDDAQAFIANICMNKCIILYHYILRGQQLIKSNYAQSQIEIRDGILMHACNPSTVGGGCASSTPAHANSVNTETLVFSFKKYLIKTVGNIPHCEDPKLISPIMNESCK